MKFKTEILANETIIAQHAQCDIIRRTPNAEGFIEITTNDSLTFSNYNNGGEFYAMDSAQYYREAGYTEEQIAERLEEDFKNWGATQYAIGNLGSSITAHSRARELHLSLTFGDKVLFCNKKFTVEADHNRNAKLVAL